MALHPPIQKSDRPIARSRFRGNGRTPRRPDWPRTLRHRAAALVACALALAALLLTSTVAYAASVQCQIDIELGKTAETSYAESLTFFTNNKTGAERKPIPTYFSELPPQGSGASADDPYVIDFGPQSTFAFAMPAQLNDGWGGLFSAESKAAITIKAKEGNTTNTYLEVRSLQAEVASASIKDTQNKDGTWTHNYDKLQEGVRLLGPDYHLLAIQGSDVIIGKDFKLTNKTPADGLRAGATAESKTVKCGTIAIDGEGSLTLKGFEAASKTFIDINGRITNHGALTIEGAGEAHTGAHLTSGVENDGVSIENHGELAIEGGTVDGDVVVKEGTARITGGTIAGDLIVEGGKVEISGDARITGSIIAKAGTTTISSGSIEGKVEATAPEALRVTGGSFRNLVDPKLLEGIGHLTVSGTGASDRLYAYSKEAPPKAPATTWPSMPTLSRRAPPCSAWDSRRTGWPRTRRPPPSSGRSGRASSPSACPRNPIPCGPSSMAARARTPPPSPRVATRCGRARSRSRSMRPASASSSSRSTIRRSRASSPPASTPSR